MADRKGTQRKLTLAGEAQVPAGEANVRDIANNMLFVAQHQQNLRDGFVPTGEISASADAGEQVAFDKAFAKKVREIEAKADTAGE